MTETTVDVCDNSEEEYVTPLNESINTSFTIEPRNKKQKITPFQQNLLDLMKNPPTQVRSENDIDPDKAFLLSFLPDFKKMNESQKLDFKLLFIQSVKQILNPPSDSGQALNSNIQQINYPNHMLNSVSYQNPFTNQSYQNFHPICTQQYNQSIRPSSSHPLPPVNYNPPTSPDYSQEEGGIIMHHSV